MDTPIPMYLAPPIGPINYPPIAPIASYQSAYPFQQASVSYPQLPRCRSRRVNQNAFKIDFFENPISETAAYFSFLSSNSFLQQFWKSKFLKKTSLTQK